MGLFRKKKKKGEDGGDSNSGAARDLGAEADNGHPKLSGVVDNSAKKENKVSIPRLVLGIAVFLVGMSLLFDLDSDMLWRIFPLGLFFLGLAKFMGSQTHSSRIFGTLIMVFSGIWFFEKLSLWPILIMVLGAHILWKAVGKDRLPKSGRMISATDFVRDFVIFGGSDRRVESNAFVGGDMTVIFGGVDLDLRSCSPVPGQPMVLDIFTMFGGVDIRVPEGWAISQEATAIFGGIDDQTRPPADSPAPEGPRPRLILQGYSMFGGIDIKN